uniref:fimbrillin family protein n=2 Tax=Prevotella heparinolytica TaxID=28113 RepID=UPI00359F826B
MKKKFLSYIPIFLLALVSGCEKEAKTSSADKSPVCFYLASSATTRATDKAFEKGDAIGVYATVREDNGTVSPLLPSGNFADNKKYIFDGDKFIPDGAPNSIFITSHPIDYYAYYPYNSTISNPLEFRFNVAANQDVLTKSDLMFAKNTDGTGKNNVPLKFIHKLAKVTVSYSNEHLDGAAEKAVINKAYTGSIINLSTGEIRTLTNEEKRDITMFKSKTADTYFSAIFPAQTFSAVNPFITFNNSKEFKLSADRLFESGHASELPFMGKILEHQFSILPLEKNVGSKGELFSLSITSKKYYSVNGKIIPGTEAPADYICTSTGGDWLSYDKATRQVTVSENKDTQKGRTAIMTFKQVESNKSASCTVTQPAGEVTYGAWSVTISASPTTIAASGGSSTLTCSAVRNVLTNGTVTGTESATPTISGSAAGFTLSGKTVTASNNTGTSARSVTYTASHGGKSASCTITQSAGSKQFGAWGAWTVSVSANPTTIARTGGSSTITAAATRSRVWTWNGVSASGGTESESGTPTLSASGAGFTLSGTTLSAGNNTSTSSRSCTVTASHGGKSASCTVTQPA